MKYNEIQRHRRIYAHGLKIHEELHDQTQWMYFNATKINVGLLYI